MTALFKFVPAWAWAALGGLVLALVVGGGQQIRIAGLQGELAGSRQALVDEASKLGACRTTRTNLLEQVIEQNGALADLRTAEAARFAQAELAQDQARDHSEADYQAANRLQQERTGGDSCAAAESVIDTELGL